MSGFVTLHTTLDTHAEQGEVTDDIQQFVTRRLVLVVERREVSEFLGVHMRLTHLIAEIVHTVLGHLHLIDDECVLEVPTLYQTDAQQRFDLAHEAECTCRRHLFGLLCNVCERRMLLAQDEGRESDRHIDLVMVAGLDTHDVSVLGDILDRFGDNKDVLLRILLLQTDALDLLNEVTRTTIKDRHLGGIYIDDTVVHTHRVERTERMLHGRDTPFTFLEHRTALCTRYIVRYRLIAGLFGQVDTTEADTGVGRRRVEGCRNLQAGV